MNHRELGRSGVLVSEVGFGGWGLGGDGAAPEGGVGRGPRGWGGVSAEASTAALDAALQAGIDFVDTALGYGDGRSERIIGEVVRGCRDRVTVATKATPRNGVWVAPHASDPEDFFPAAWLHECVDQSLRNTGFDVLDVLQLHVWNDSWLGSGTWMDALTGLRDAGKIRLIGISINNHEPASGLRAVQSGAVDTVQVIYNIFDQSPEDELFAACEQHGVGVIARVPFDEGALTGQITPDSVFEPGDFRNAYFVGERKLQVHERVGRICDDLGIGRAELAEVALRFTLSPPAVSTVIPGMRSVRNVERNVRAGDGRGLPPEQLACLRAHRWVRNYY